jgi:hypothetical protein
VVSFSESIAQVTIQQALQTGGTKTAHRITRCFKQYGRQWRQSHAPAWVARWAIHHAAVEGLTTLYACTHCFPPLCCQRLSFSVEKDKKVCANIDDFACKISPVFYQHSLLT